MESSENSKLFIRMRNLFVSRQAKISVDILLGAGLLAAGICSKLQGNYTNYWASPHCITSILWFLLILVHIAQHWRVIKAFTRKKVIMKNRITLLTVVTFIVMTLSIFTFFMEITIPLLHAHGIISRLFILMVIIHTIDKCRQKKKSR